MAKRRRKPPYEAGEGSHGARIQEDTSSVYDRGQTVIPKAVRDALAIEHGTRLRWEVTNGAIRVFPIPKNPIEAARGVLKETGFTYETFMAERHKERQREREQEKRKAGRWRASSTRQR